MRSIHCFGKKEVCHLGPQLFRCTPSHSSEGKLGLTDPLTESTSCPREEEAERDMVTGRAIGGQEKNIFPSLRGRGRVYKIRSVTSGSQVIHSPLRLLHVRHRLPYIRLDLIRGESSRPSRR